MTDLDQPDQPDQHVLDGHAVEAEQLADWRLLFRTLHARFETGDFATGVRLVVQVGELAEAAGHHPELDLSYGHVVVRLRSHDAGGTTQRDVRLAREISAAAAGLGAPARPDLLSVLELGLDTADWDEIAPFWAALLDYEVRPGLAGEVHDPHGTRPAVWAQRTEPHETPRQRWHLDLRVPPEVVEPRIAAALAAGGTLVSDERAPAFWVLADVQGNQACLTTWQGRD
ncbi:MAG: Pterin-4-alpha-carbinolamine dehydratase [Nocardioides sp.]|nr:Pterin-4-alpha-carbinolamine dehydratase [Nocardioides sp.]